MTLGLQIAPLDSFHDRKAFSSGVEQLDRYLREFAAQDAKRRISNCFVALDIDQHIAGYYTLAASGLPLAELPDDVKKRLPRYSLIPAAIIGRLAIDLRFQGRRLGAALLLDAAARASRSDPAIFALLVGAKNGAAVAFYEHHGFRRFPSKPTTLFLPIETALSTIRNPV